MISKKLFPTQLNSTAKIFRTAVIQESLALDFKWNGLNCLNFVTAHAFLTGWYLFTFFTVAPSVTLDFCFILLTSNDVIWASLVRTHRAKLEVKEFIFHVVVFSRETFQTLAWKFLLCILQKVFGVYIFPNFVLV